MPPISHPASGEPTAAELVRDARQAEAWVDRVQSLRLRLKGKWTHTPQGIALATAKLREEKPDREITPQAFPRLLPEVPQTLDLAFDERRLYTREQSDTGLVRLSVRCWDGQRGVAHEKFVGQREHYWIGRAHAPVVSTFFLGCIPWPRAGTHRFWWYSPQRLEDQATYHVPPEAFELLGRETFREKDCYVVEHAWRDREVVEGMFIGVDDYRLYGSYHLHCPEAVELEIVQDIVQEQGGPRGSRPQIEA
jgi:hypothetical protein